ncbi:MAG: flagellar hook-length control protein FliK [Parvularculaceae bacterium]|nr:flagellar hook-length control protein FliK [Parvularculaceae bacterium]
MTEATNISSFTAETALRRGRRPAPQEAPAFSYALAAASLEKSAAKSLEAHGARPATAGGTEKRPPVASSRAERLVGDPRQGDRTAAGNGGAPDASTQPRQDAGTQPKPGAANAASLPAPAAQVAASPLIPASAKALEAAVLREIAAARKPTAALKAARQPAEPTPLKAEFAEILAKRLEKTSVFDIRLDPPTLGRVEGRFVVGDDGKAALSLAFDNQSAFDLFSRDEQTLRQALSDAGFNFGAGDFAFSFRAPPQPEAPSALPGTPPETPRSIDPVFHAGWSAGALDIRI